MKKIIFTSIITFFVIGITVSGYLFIRKITSDEAIKKRFLDTLKDFGETKIDHAHIDIFEGISLDNLSFVGTGNDLQGKSFKIPKVILKHNLPSLIKGQINISSAIIIAPELTIEKPTDIWSLLNTIKANFDKTEMPLYIDALRCGVEVRDLKIHIKENPETNTQEIKLSGIDMTFLPYAGSFENIIIKGDIEDTFLGSYSFTMKLHPGVPSLDIEAYANNIVMNEEFCDRFPYIGKMLWDAYKPTGKINVSCRAAFNNQNGQKKMDYLVTINLNGLNAMYEGWPIPIYNLSGEVELNTEKLYLKGIAGYIKSGDCTSQAVFRAEIDLRGLEKTVVMTIPNLFVNQELLKNIPEVGEQVLSKIHPTGLVDLTFQYNKGEKQEGNYSVVVNCKGLEINSPELSLPISYVNGQFKLLHNLMLLNNVSGFIQCGKQAVFTEMNGVCDMNSGRRIFNFRAPNLSITETLLKNLPDKAMGERLWTNLNPAGRADISANFQGFNKKEDNDYSVEVDFKDCEITPGTYKIPLWGLEGRLEVNKDGFFSKNIDAKCCGGHVDGALFVETTAEPYQYKGEVGFSRIELKELIQKITRSENAMSGLLSGSIKFQGKGADTKNFYAVGQINVEEGYLSDVPIILSVFNLLNLSIPKKESFRTAQINFTVKDGIIHVDRGRLYSDTIELIGQGDVKLGGDLHIDVVAGFSKDFFSQFPLVGRVFDFVVGGVRKQLTMVEIKGTFLNPESHLVPFRPVTRKIRNMFDLLPKNNHDKASDGEVRKEE